MCKFKVISVEKSRSDRCSSVSFFEAMGPSKNAYLEDVLKMANNLYKMSKIGPKNFQK